MAAASPRSYPFQVRGSMQTVLALRLLAPEDPNLFTLLLDKVAHSPDFFRNAPMVLDVAALTGRVPIDLVGLSEQLREHRLMAVGIQNGNEAWNEAALAAGLAIFAGGGTAPRVVAEGRGEARRAAPSAPPRGAAIVKSEPVRGGQQIHSADGDLVVTAAVGHGAELAAAGHIHVYGPLRGRAFAGIGGDETAMIFCDELRAELLSIAGVHLVNEEIDPRHLGKRVRVQLVSERLVVQALGS